MDVYTLDSSFLKVKVIDNFESIIWTERYSKPGDFNLVTTRSNKIHLPVGRFVHTPDSKEIMQIETQDIDGDKMTVTGRTLLKILEERVIYGSSLPEIQSGVWLITNKLPGELIGYIINEKAINPSIPKDAIYRLSLGSIDVSGSNINVAIPHGTVLDASISIAESYDLGMSLYLDSAFAPGDYNLKFTVYKGIDRTDPANGPIVKFSPSMDSLTNIKELRSAQGYKTIAYAFAVNEPNVNYFSIVPSSPTSDIQSDFDRNVLLVLVDDVTLESTGAVDPPNYTPAELEVFKAAVDQRAKNALANNNYTKVIDGEIVPQNLFRYGYSYNMGDIVALQGYDNIVQKARVTEFIRSQDSDGERAYPTVSIID